MAGPGPEDARRLLCAACVMLAKQQLHENVMDEMRAALADGKTGRKKFMIPPGMLMEDAVTVAIWGDSPQLPPMPVCWTHAAGITLKPRSMLDPGNGAIPLPKGLIKGQG